MVTFKEGFNKSKFVYSGISDDFCMHLFSPWWKDKTWHFSWLFMQWISELPDLPGLILSRTDPEIIRSSEETRSAWYDVPWALLRPKGQENPEFSASGTSGSFPYNPVVGSDTFRNGPVGPEISVPKTFFKNQKMHSKVLSPVALLYLLETFSLKLLQQEREETWYDL